MGSDAANTGAPRVITLDANGLDRLEQVLLGAAPLGALDDLIHGASEDALLQDGENTPLARIAKGVLTPLQPLARGAGLQWDPKVRLTAAEVQQLAHAADSKVITLAATTPPSNADLEQLVARANASRARLVILAALASRNASANAGDDRRVGGAGLLRSLLAAVDALAAQLPGVKVLPLVLPWPQETTQANREHHQAVTELLRAYGATEVFVGGDQHVLHDDELGALLPAASRAEIERVRAARSAPPAIIFFTGLSGSGKSTIARALAETLRDDGALNVVLLDGDEMRRRISQDLGFDRASRNKNVERIAVAAAEIAREGGIAIAAPIAPFTEGRARVREVASAAARFLMIYISTPLEVCEARDRKGLYAKARTGEVKEFTGISSPYEPPVDADITIDASVVSVEEAVARVVAALAKRAQEAERPQ